MKTDYSEAELKLLKAMKVPQVMLDHIAATVIYKSIAVDAFCKNLSGPHIEALRRGMMYLEDGGYRGNKTFDKLIEF